MCLSRLVGFLFQSSSMEGISRRDEEMEASSFDMTDDFRSSYGVLLLQADMMASDTWERIS